MRTNIITAVGVSACFLLSGCSTFVEGKRAASAQEEGVEYSLPVPVLRVTPMPDGTIDVQVEMLPDPDNTYRLTTKSWVSSYTLDVTRENGMLKSVSLDAKSDAVAGALVDARASIIKAKAEADKKDSDAAAAAAKEQAKTISDAKMAVVIADAKVTALEAGDKPDPVVVAAAKVDLAVAKAKLAALQQAATDPGKSGFNTAKAANPDLDANAKVSAAPVLFRVVPVPDEGTVRLVAFESKAFLATSSAAQKEDLPAKVEDLTLGILGDGVLHKGKALSLTLVANRPNLKSDPKGTGVRKIGQGDALLDLVNLATPQPDDGKGKTTFTVTLKDEIAPGSYELVMRMVDKTSQPMLADPVTFVVKK
jgi:hypothetical protein